MFTKFTNGVKHEFEIIYLTYRKWKSAKGS